MTVTSTPKVPFRVRIIEEHEPYSRTGRVFRVFREDGTPLYMGAETHVEALALLRENEPLAEVVP